MTKALQRFANKVVDGSLDFLNAWDVVGAHDQREICQAPAKYFASVIA
jgi:hypothetical protein